MSQSKEAEDAHSTHVEKRPFPDTPVATFAVEESNGEQKVTFRLVMITLVNFLWATFLM